MSLIRFTSELSQKSKRSKSSSRSWLVAFLGVLNVLTALLNFLGVGWALARGLLEFAMRHVGLCGVRHGGCVWDGCNLIRRFFSSFIQSSVCWALASQTKGTPLP